MADEPENKEEGQTEAESQQTEAEGQQTEAEGQTEGTKDEAKADDKPKTVPYERVEEMASKIKQLEEQITMNQQQLALARANPPQGREAPAPQFDIFKEVGLEDDEDVPNQGQLKQIFGHYGTMFSRQLADIAFQQAHPDYAELVGTADELASHKYAEPFAAAIKLNPALLTMIAKSADPRLAAYEVAKLQKSKTPEKSVEIDEAKEAIDEAVKTAARVKSSANTKGGGQLSEEGRYAKMSDADFVALALSNGASI